MPKDVRFYVQNAPNSMSAGSSPQNPLWELTELPGSKLDLRGSTSKGREGREGKGRERKGRTPLRKNLDLVSVALPETQLFGYC